MQCDCRLFPLLLLPLNRTPAYTYPPTPFWTLPFLLASQFLLPTMPARSTPRATLRTHLPQAFLTSWFLRIFLFLLAPLALHCLRRLLLLLRLFPIIAGTFLWGQCGGGHTDIPQASCSVHTHEILSTRQYMLAGLNKVRDTAQQAHTYASRGFPPRAYPTFSRQGSQSEFSSWRVLFAKKLHFYTAKNLVFIFFGFETYEKVGKRYQKGQLSRSLWRTRNRPSAIRKLKWIIHQIVSGHN